MSKPKFKILKKSKKSRARTGIINGVLQTPAFFPVATKACLKTLDSEDIKRMGFKNVLCNTYHLMLQPGSSIVKDLHQFMNFKGIIATDSGGFQVFSLGKGLEHGTGKILSKKEKKPSMVKIREKGVYFKSHLNGKEIFLSPEKSMQIQKELGSDIIFAFDECTSPLDDYEYTKKAMERTHRWAVRCLESYNKKQMLFGIVQGGNYKKLRKESAQFIGSLDFAGFGIGGSLGKPKKRMFDVLDWTIPLLPEEKPKHFLGIGYIEDLEESVKRGIDLFDCVYPTRIARHGIALTNQGNINLKKTCFSNDKSPLDKKCSCFVCQNYTKSYISHLIRAKEITGMRLLTIHNLCFIKSIMESIRNKIEKGLI